MRFKVDINCDGAAFVDADGERDISPELRRLLPMLARVDWRIGDVWPLHDINGNTVGRAELVED